MRQQVRFTIAGTLGLLLSLVASQAFGVVRDYEILLTPQGQSGTLRINLAFGGSCWLPVHNGCVGFDIDTVGVMSLRVAGNPNGLTCTHPDPSKVAHRVITKIELTDVPLGGSPTSAKGDFSGGLADTWLKTFAFPSVNQSTGVLYDVPVNEGLARMAVVNLNSHPEVWGTKPFWYKVTVTRCSDPTDTWETDPRGDNKGTN